eukprot:1162066-Pelagomonas_calceolata.AAC.5
MGQLAWLALSNHHAGNAEASMPQTSCWMHAAIIIEDACSNRCAECTQQCMQQSAQHMHAAMHAAMPCQ